MDDAAFRNYAPDSLKRIHEGFTQISEPIVKSSSESSPHLLGSLKICIIPAPDQIGEALILAEELVNDVLMLAEYIPPSPHFCMLLAMTPILNYGVPREAWSPVCHL